MVGESGGTKTDGDVLDQSEGKLVGTLENYVLPFQIESAGVRGRLVRLGPVVDDLLSRHNYPEPVSRLLGEAILLTVMLGHSLKFDGKLTLQTSSDGPITFLVVQFRAPGDVRAYASYEDEGVAEAIAEAGESDPRLLGKGHMALTIEPGGGLERYQGFVELEGENLVDAAHTYFRQSEQIPSLLRVAVAPQFVGGRDGERGGWAWRAGGLMIQKVGAEGGRNAIHATEAEGQSAEDWNRASMLGATVEDHEILDPTLSPERLLIRLFHEERVRAFPASAISAFCQCSRERVEDLLKRFPADRISEMVQDDGKVSVTCEFCNSEYDFDPDALFGHRGE
ncbi:Hsp33 family molecular chaperone [Dichotomicrobium thermohalophilum]|uniref:Molecular chaperone Hsp33 n=1 Tax=Dichotomicrobium thermohalophilum TaxID=933063 RepID=A0A397PEU5_9HYPH|nr:Hsp33 family molecular chaperone [Dichotomicrobium thermohalophilum]RIA47522.1 molecular chaperone Hsp33 [Dichotomicrobium thermohalophilum]